jgi:trehalose 6-phosphate phosphatase
VAITASLSILSRGTAGDTSAVPAIAELLEPLRAEPQASAILCDVDGTLAPIVARPDDATVPEETRATLSELATRYALVACISGRRAADARRLVGIDRLVYVGNHGFEILHPGEAEPRLDPGAAGRADSTRRFVEDLNPSRLDVAGMRIEDKGPIQALHWRGAPSQAAAELQAEEVAALAQAEGLVPRWGRKVLELRPVAGVDKGAAVLRLLQENTADNALYAGDDVTDLDAFRALCSMRSSERLRTAVCVGVDSDEAPPGLADQADVLVDGTEEFVAVLRALLD